MKILIIVLSIITILTIVIFMFFHVSNKLKNILIKINIVKPNIELLLNNKLNTLENIGTLLTTIDNGKISQQIGRLKTKKTNLFQLSNNLFKIYNDLNKFLLERKSFIPDNELSQLLEDIYTNEISLVASQQFYNENVEQLNKLIYKFPTNIISKIKKIKPLDLYTISKLEFFEILKSD